MRRGKRIRPISDRNEETIAQEFLGEELNRRMRIRAKDYCISFSFSMVNHMMQSMILTPDSDVQAARSSCDFVHICLKVSAIGSLA
mmetsp:Transcript_16045/g.44379  ORF Transcript_16045/g.44379 Transcript_16045/m.44379 type:complete len:86 (+) Transcript_16045:429-686(+)